jgi:molecular chaperone DnaK
MADQVFGIDLGTTYSAIAYINDVGQAEVIKNRETEDTTPSVVYFESETNFVVGKEAKNEMLPHQAETVALAKRHMGTDFSQDIRGKTYRPETVSALILRDLVDYAREATGIESNKVVITVPAYFGLSEKEATRQAGEIAGLDVIGIVTEPVAAALSVGITGEEAKTLFVYDLGGGTFDCTIMQLSPGKVDVIVIDGHRMLGGADWDAELGKLINDKFIAQMNLDHDPTEDEDFAQRLLTKVEELKKALSRKDRANVILSFGGVDEKVEISRAEFEEATRVLVDRTLEIVRRTLDSAQKKCPGLVLDEILLVGGSSRMPMIEASLEVEMGWTLRKTDRDLAVAKGAAVYGQGTIRFEELVDQVIVETTAASDAPQAPSTGTIADRYGNTVEISNVLSRSLGVLYVYDNQPPHPNGEEYVYFSAHAGDSLPLQVEFQAATRGQVTTELQIHIFEQSSELEDSSPTANREITSEQGAVLRDLPNLPAGSPIEFILAIDSEGAATLSAYEPTTAQRIQMPARLSVMQKEDVAAAKAEIATMSRRDD